MSSMSVSIGIALCGGRESMFTIVRDSGTAT